MVEEYIYNNAGKIHSYVLASTYKAVCSNSGTVTSVSKIRADLVSPEEQFENLCFDVFFFLSYRKDDMMLVYFSIIFFSHSSYRKKKKNLSRYNVCSCKPPPGINNLASFVSANYSFWIGSLYRLYSSVAQPICEALYIALEKSPDPDTQS